MLANAIIQAAGRCSRTPRLGSGAMCVARYLNHSASRLLAPLLPRPVPPNSPTPAFAQGLHPALTQSPAPPPHPAPGHVRSPHPGHAPAAAPPHDLAPLAATPCARAQHCHAPSSLHPPTAPRTPPQCRLGTERAPYVPAPTPPGCPPPCYPPPLPLPLPLNIPPPFPLPLPFNTPPPFPLPLPLPPAISPLFPLPPVPRTYRTAFHAAGPWQRGPSTSACLPFPLTPQPGGSRDRHNSLSP